MGVGVPMDGSWGATPCRGCRRPHHQSSGWSRPTGGKKTFKPQKENLKDEDIFQDSKVWAVWGIAWDRLPSNVGIFFPFHLTWVSNWFRPRPKPVVNAPTVQGVQCIRWIETKQDIHLGDVMALYYNVALPKFNMEPKSDGFPKGISYSKGAIFRFHVKFWEGKRCSNKLTRSPVHL